MTERRKLSADALQRLAPTPEQPQQETNGKASRRPNQLSALMERVSALGGTGLLPHEVLCSVAQGRRMPMGLDEHGDPLRNEEGEIIWWQPSRDERLDAAKAGAPFFAPKLSAVDFTRNLDDDTLLSLILELAQSTGLTATLTGVPAETVYEGSGGTYEAGPPEPAGGHSNDASKPTLRSD